MLAMRFLPLMQPTRKRIHHYETLVRYMEWQDVGQLMATGCGARSLVEKSPFADMAYKIGAAL